MNILVVCQYYYPEQFRINDICEGLVKEGHSVTVLTGLPNYPTGIIPNEYKKGKNRKQSINGVDIIRTFEVGRGNSKLKLMLNYVSYMISASLKVLGLKKEFDVVYVYQLSPVIMAIPALLYKKINKKKVVLYCQDLWPESLKAMNIKEQSLLFKLIHNVSKYIYKNCDHVAVSSKSFIKYLQEVNGIETSKISYIPQHAENFYTEVYGKEKNNNCVDFLFAGNLGRVQDIDCILKAIKEIKELDGFKLHLVGDGSYLDKIKNMIKEFKIQDKVVLHGKYPIEEMSKFYEMADVFLLTLRGDSTVGLTVPSKLQGYMAAGKPVLAAINGAAAEIIEESKCGVCVQAGDYESLSEKMKEFIEVPDKYKECGKNGNKYFMRNFTLQAYQKQLNDKLKEVI